MWKRRLRCPRNRAANAAATSSTLQPQEPLASQDMCVSYFQEPVPLHITGGLSEPEVMDSVGLDCLSHAPLQRPCSLPTPDPAATISRQRYHLPAKASRSSDREPLPVCLLALQHSLLVAYLPPPQSTLQGKALM